MIKVNSNMLPIIIQHYQYFNERCANSKGQATKELYRSYVDGTAKREWSRSATRTAITGVMKTETDTYTQLVTETVATCSCPAYKYSEVGTCKHIQTMLLLLWDKQIEWI